MSPKKEDSKKDPVASLEELEKTVAIRPRKNKPAADAAPAAAKASPAQAAAPAAHRPKAKPAPANVSPVRVRLVKSGICAPRDQKATLQGLGLRRLNQEVVRSDTPSLRGMLHKVRHLVEVSATK